MFGVFIGFFSTICYGVSALVDSHISNSLFKKSSVIMFFNTITNIIRLPFVLFRCAGGDALGCFAMVPWSYINLPPLSNPLLQSDAES